jgi:hypothetical protein
MILFATGRQLDAVTTCMRLAEDQLSPSGRAAVAAFVVANADVDPQVFGAGYIDPPPTGAELIARKRAGHAPKGWTANHDDRCHGDGMLREVAADLINGDCDAWGLSDKVIDEIDGLAVAGSLIAAEIDRLQRIKARKPLTPQTGDQK